MCSCCYKKRIRNTSSLLWYVSPLREGLLGGGGAASTTRWEQHRVRQLEKHLCTLPCCPGASQEPKGSSKAAEFSECGSKLPGLLLTSSPVSASLCAYVALSVSRTQVLIAPSILGRRAPLPLPETPWFVTEDASSGIRHPVSPCAVTILTPQHIVPKHPCCGNQACHELCAADGLGVKLGYQSSLLAHVHQGCGFLPCFPR